MLPAYACWDSAASARARRQSRGSDTGTSSILASDGAMLSLKTVLGQGICLELLPSLDVPLSAAIASYPVEGKGLRFSGEVGLEADALERQLLADCCPSQQAVIGPAGQHWLLSTQIRRRS